MGPGTRLPGGDQRLSRVARERRPSRQTAEVLAALAADPPAWRHGYELGLEVGLRSGSLYPILVRLSDRELLESRWEAHPPAGRPPRHLYRLTATGLEYAAAHARAPVAQAPRGRLQRPGLRSAS
jgi:DNA-binding PadR family transcriptional regulator